MLREKPTSVSRCGRFEKMLISGTFSLYIGALTRAEGHELFVLKFRLQLRSETDDCGDLLVLILQAAEEAERAQSEQTARGSL